MQKITVEPGVNEIIQIAEGHPNRIVTPFKAPRVVTTAAASVETSDNVIYVAPTGPALITMFLTETGDESVSISLTLQPKKIPPRELRLDLPPGVFLPDNGEGDSLAKRRGRSDSDRAYVARAGEVFDQLAQGRVPDDLAFSEQAPPPYPLCTVENGYEVSFAEGQYLLGQNQEVYVGVVRNSGPAVASFQEPWCYSEGVIAVALWPRATLQPGEFAEIYLARTVPDPSDIDLRAPRPSLLQARKP
ncbi:MAG: type-F conjugative transfer system secretin TraK [Alphaproteobacteria bacterium]